MIPLAMRFAFRDALWFVRFRYFMAMGKYILASGICWWALSVQTQYRVPSRFVFLILPWVGGALTVLSVLYLLNHLRFWVSIDDPLKVFLRRIEWWANMLIRVFVYYSLLLLVNAKLDLSTPVNKNTEITSMSGVDTVVLSGLGYSWADLRSSERSEKVQRIILQPGEKRILWGGEAVVLQIKKGYFKIPWVSRIDPDEEKYSRDILKLSPTASLAWRRLINFYLEHQRWEEASSAAHEYLRLCPNDYLFAMETGGYLDVSKQYDKGIPLLEYVIAHKPTYEAYQLLGWALSFQGNKKRAAEVLEASIPLRPDDWEAYYHLGYVYSDMAKFVEAEAAFMKALERHPDFPEVETQLDNLRRWIAGEKAILDRHRRPKPASAPG